MFFCVLLEATLRETALHLVAVASCVGWKNVIIGDR